MAGPVWLQTMVIIMGRKIKDGRTEDLFINPQLQHLARRSRQLHSRLQLVFRNLHSCFCPTVYEETPMGSEQTDAVCHSETKPATQSPAQQKINNKKVTKSDHAEMTSDQCDNMKELCSDTIHSQS